MSIGAALVLGSMLSSSAAADSGGGPIPYSTEDVTFGQGAVTLAGRLYLPRSAQPLPAVVFTHGSGDAGRDSPRYIEEATYLAGQGLAVLLFDKRGVGGSSGDWRKADFHALAADAAAAVRYLRTRPEIAGGAIGLRGASQAGYVLPIVASLDPSVAFLVLISPPMVTPYEQIVYNVEAELRAAGFADAQVGEALRYTRAGLDVARGTLAWEAYARQLEQAKSQPWFKIAAGPESADDWMFSWLRGILDFDPTPYLQRSACPVLVFFAGHDTETPVDRARLRLEQALAGRPHRIVLYENANHDLRVIGGDGKKALAPGYLETLGDWIRAQTKGRRKRP